MIDIGFRQLFFCQCLEKITVETDFKIKFGNDSVLQYKTRKSSFITLDKTFKASRIFHWEFERKINMAENRDKTAYDALNTRFEARTSEWRARIN